MGHGLGLWLSSGHLPLSGDGLGFHLTRCLRTLRATSGGRARRARRALVRARLGLVFWLIK